LYSNGMMLQIFGVKDVYPVDFARTFFTKSEDDAVNLIVAPVVSLLATVPMMILYVLASSRFSPLSMESFERLVTKVGLDNSQVRARKSSVAAAVDV